MRRKNRGLDRQAAEAAETAGTLGDARPVDRLRSLALPLTPPSDHSLRGDRSRREAGVGGDNFQTIRREGNHQIWQPFFWFVVLPGIAPVPVVINL
jgi:hypothetical protein